MARLTHALDEIYSDTLERLSRVRYDSAFDFDLADFLLHVEDRFGKDISDDYLNWYGEDKF